MGEATEEEKIGVLLLNLGGPDSLHAIKPFLYNLFSDREIIKLGPPFFQKPLALIISILRSNKTKRIYRLIGGKSPIFDITLAQADALEKALNSSLVIPHLSFFFKVYVGMRYWHPFIGEVVPEIKKNGVKKLIAISMYPQFSSATTGSSLTELKKIISHYPIEVFSITSWFNHPLYVEALVDGIKRGIESFESELNIHVIFSAHNLPESLIKEGDPYVKQIKETIKEITKRLNINWSLAFQSKTGPVKWLKPTTETMLETLARGGYKNILIVPISFVSDHIETLYEIDILYKNRANKLGLVLKRVDSLNTHPLFIGALKDIVLNGLREKGWI
ncbi:MAG: ferrochelatase [Nitrospirae bacterium]|nr:ferrochelatase [Nitrospirota bacterium]